MASCTRTGCRRGTFYGWNGQALGDCFKCHGTGTLPAARARGAALEVEVLRALSTRRIAPEPAAANVVVGLMGPGGLRLREAAMARRAPAAAVAPPVAARPVGAPPVLVPGADVMRRLREARAAGASAAERYAIAFGPDEVGIAPAEPEPVAVAAVEPEPVEAAAEAEVAHGIRNGYFTVVFGAEDRVTLRVQADDWSGPDKKGVQGQQSVAYLNGPDNWNSYRTFGFVVQDAARPFKSAPERAVKALRFLMSGTVDTLKGAAEAYAVESGRCSRCHRMLTVPASISAGLGPDCAGKGDY